MLATTADEMALLFRQDVDDVLSTGDTDDTDRLWKDYEVYRYMTVACDRLAKDTDAFLRVLRLTVTADDDTVPLSNRVLNIFGARLETADCEVVPRNANEGGPLRLSDYGLTLRAAPTWTRDYERNALVLAPVPTQADTLILSCSVSISAPMMTGAPLPFVDIDDQLLLLHAMKAQAYLKQDAETQDMTRAKIFDASYRAGASERKYERLRQRRQPGVVRMDGW